MKIGAIIQARMGSKRLPGKVMREVAGKPLLKYIIERLEHSAFRNSIVIATSTDESDTIVETFCRSLGIDCYRGSQHNVAGRFMDALNIYKFDGFIRINGDSPLIDQNLIDRGVDIFRQDKFEIVTNVLPRTYPPGQSVEIINTETFIKGYRMMKVSEDFEHVTPFFYRNRENFRIFNFNAEETYSGIHLAVDTEQDLKNINTIFGMMTRPHWQYGLQEIFSIFKNSVANL